ncbi:hypothetical protein ASPWEDRAFT_38525 [Aspergillus wentii DTO 134E9]|uniref:Uncharacterized protein n=1 Tax=Aspergillus wentii DTO 134E9 TaxID=1073089 RepID=A0A1L9RPK1_ASPWE|nr:uncharacterized protein ASPWEDRAFT_38525 [Aspergillus wentii DTO 134E9]KAI9924083.1 hypothetical protein MW887_007322 [Aspergillus wentii]OJJ36876.1 hypothetical protein ASPWEDRAFT_38525 [Aspergillus wentii DTO 134E9]
MDAAALLCNICPKRPNFSDVSHLLTHISSKAHLSHYFKLQVRSHQESQAGDLLDEYDQWYKANNLAKLLSDRMASKEARKRKSQGKNSSHGTAYPTKKATGYKPTPVATTCPSPENSLTDYLDPRLSDTYLNVDSVQTNRNVSYSASYVTPATSSITDLRTHPRPDYRLPVSPQTTLSYQWKQERELDSGDETSMILQATPIWSRRVNGKIGTISQLPHGDLGYDPFVDDNDSFDSPGTEVDKDRADEIARLKGVLWPGMDIFDSATEQMRRKRNQKKDQSILEMMEKTSMCVEPTELVFSPTGILRKQRVISGNVEDSSPLKGETPIPKRRPARPKRVLSQVDSNAQRGQDSKRAKKMTGLSLSRHTEPQRGLQLPQSPLPPLPLRYGNGYYPSHGDDVDELSMTIKGLESRSRSGFTVFHDEPNQYKLSFKENDHDDGPRFAMGDLSHTGFSRRDTLAYNPFQPSTPSTYASNFAGMATRIPADKENIEPLLNANGRIDPVVGWHSPVMKRCPTADTGYPPQFFFGNTQCSGFSPFDGPSIPSAYSFNPLAASFPKLPVEEYPIYDTEPTDDHKPKPASRATSVDATISEIEEDDFDRLYLDGSSY